MTDSAIVATLTWLAMTCIVGTVFVASQKRRSLRNINRKEQAVAFASGAIAFVATGLGSVYSLVSSAPTNYRLLAIGFLALFQYLVIGIVLTLFDLRFTGDWRDQERRT